MLAAATCKSFGEHLFSRVVGRGISTLTLPPLSATVRNLTLDDLEDEELQRRVRNLEDPLQDRLERCKREGQQSAVLRNACADVQSSCTEP